MRIIEKDCCYEAGTGNCNLRRDYNKSNGSKWHKVCANCQKWQQYISTGQAGC